MFENVMENYKKLSLKDKREANIYEIKKLAALLEQLCIENHISYREIKSNEVLESNSASEVDYLEAQYVYISYLKEVLGALLNAKF